MTGDSKTFKFYFCVIATQQTFTRSKLTIERLETGVKLTSF